jgi:hypothetical protein
MTQQKRHPEVGKHRPRNPAKNAFRKPQSPVTFKFITFSIIAISVISLSPSLLQLRNAATSSSTFYPLRFSLSEISSRNTVSASPNARAHNEVKTDSAVESFASAIDEAPIGALAAKQKDAARTAAALPYSRPSHTGSNRLQSSGENQKFGNLIAVEYDLGAQAERSAGTVIKPSGMLAGTMDVRTEIRVGKASPTKIDLKLGNRANIYVNAAQLSSILEAQGKAFKATSGAGPDGFVSLDDLRDKGFEVRYDAIGNALVLDVGK